VPLQRKRPLSRRKVESLRDIADKERANALVVFLLATMSSRHLILSNRRELLGKKENEKEKGKEKMEDVHNANPANPAKIETESTLHGGEKEKEKKKETREMRMLLVRPTASETMRMRHRKTEESPRISVKSHIPRISKIIFIKVVIKARRGDERRRVEGEETETEKGEDIPKIDAIRRLVHPRRIEREMIITHRKEKEKEREKEKHRNIEMILADAEGETKK